MQSILQYRRFGQHIKTQYEQDRNNARDMAGRRKLNKEYAGELIAEEKPSRPRSSSDPNAELNPRDEDSSAESLRTAPADVSVPPQGEDEGLDRGTTAKAIETQNSISRIGTTLGRTLTGVDVRKPTTKEGKGDKEVFVVGFRNSKDRLNPHNWSYTRRWFATINVALIGWIVGVASSIDSGALKQATADFGVSSVTESLATGLFLVGFGVGALIAGPFSEEFGRNPVYITTLLLYMIWIMASALAPNIGAQLVFRLLAGVFASTPLACAGGSVSDLWSPEERVYSFPIFANAAFSGPIVGATIGSFIGQSYLSWRWCEWFTLIGSGVVLALVVFFQPETYPPILLRWKASHLRKLTGDERYLAQAEIRGDSFGSRVLRALYRPFLLTAQEPTVILFGLYLTIVYIILFGFLTGFQFIFTETYQLSQGVTGLCFLGIVVGLCLASAWVPFIRSRYVRALREAERNADEAGEDAAAVKLPPETRLWFAMLGAPALPISLFWMGWTARPDISIWSPIAATVLFGYATLCIFISCYQYLIDSYELYAASALASVTVIRYLAAGGMVEVAIPLYGNLGVNWACTLLGCLSALMTPVPYLFYWYGAKIRKYSKFTVSY